MPLKRLGTVTGDSYYRAVVRGMRGDPFAWYVSEAGPLGRKASRHGLGLPSLDEVADAPAAIAHLNRDRWLVACPDCGRDFQFAFASGLFMCSRCWNEAIAGLYRRAVFPENRVEIEAVLGDLPRESRNALPGWSASQALAEAQSPRSYSSRQYREALLVTAEG